MSIETWQANYPTFVGEELGNHTLRETLAIRKETDPRGYIWTARLSTGLFGKHDCPSGNSIHAPKGENEVAVFVGSLGLETAIDLGFIPCGKCQPENTQGFWESAKDAIEWNYPTLSDIRQFADKSVVSFDVRRVDWEILAPYLTSLPNRLYVPENLTEDDLRIIEARFKLLNFKLPPVGFYVNGPPWFKEYEIK